MLDVKSVNFKFQSNKRYMPYNFDKIIDRSQTNCIKHDAVSNFFGRENLLPLWVADMDFETPNFYSQSDEGKVGSSCLWLHIL